LKIWLASVDLPWQRQFSISLANCIRLIKTSPRSASLSIGVSRQAKPSLEESQAIREEIAEIRKLIPSLLERVDRSVAVIDDANDKALNAILLAGDAGKKASEGAVSGFFTGLIKLPFKLIGTLASPIVKSIAADVAKKLTEKDLELIATASKKAVEAKKIGRAWKWNNPESGNSGSLTIIRKYEIRSHVCVEVQVRVSIKGKEKMNEPDYLCLNKDKKWVEAEEI
jgi:surface antigen